MLPKQGLLLTHPAGEQCKRYSQLTNTMIKVIYFQIVLMVAQQACGQVDKQREMYIDSVVEYFNAGDYEKTLLFVDKLIEKDPNDYISWTLKGRSLSNLGRTKEGLMAINKAIEINPNYYEAYGYRAFMHNSCLKCTLDDLNIALAHDPDNLKLLKIKAGYLKKAKRFEEALLVYDKILVLAPTHYTALVSRGSTYGKLGNINKAMQDFQNAIAINPNDAFAFEERAFLFMEINKFNEAIADYNKVHDIMNDSLQYNDLNAYNYNNTGFAFHKAGDNSKALENINRSLEMLPTNSYAYKNRAIVYFDLGNNEKGCVDLIKAIELGFTEKYGDEVEKLLEIHCK